MTIIFWHIDFCNMVFCKNKSKELTVLEISLSKKDDGSNTNGRISDSKSNEIDDTHFYVGNRQTYSIYEDVVFMNSNLYKEIFGKIRKEDCSLRKRIAVVKITRTGISGEKKSIYRAFVAAPANGFDTKKMALSYSSLRMLNLINYKENSDESEIDEAKGGEKYEVTAGSFIIFILRHPNYVVQLAAYSCLIGIVGILISIMGIIFH